MPRKMPKSQNVYKDTRNPFLLLILMIPIRNLMNMIEHYRWDHYTQIHVKQAHLQIKIIIRTPYKQVTTTTLNLKSSQKTKNMYQLVMHSSLS